MTDAQLYVLIGIPLFGIFSNVALFVYLSGRIDKLSERIDNLAGVVSGLAERIARL